MSKTRIWYNKVKYLLTNLLVGNHHSISNLSTTPFTRSNFVKGLSTILERWGWNLPFLSTWGVLVVARFLRHPNDITKVIVQLDNSSWSLTKLSDEWHGAPDHGNFLWMKTILSLILMSKQPFNIFIFFTFSCPTICVFIATITRWGGFHFIFKKGLTRNSHLH